MTSLHQVVRGTYLPEGDTHFSAALLKNPMFQGLGTYQLKKIDAALPFVNHKGIALDIGAHVGLWSRVLAASFDYVYAYEPIFSSILSLNIEPRFRNVVIRPFALGNINGVIGFHKELDNSGNTRVSSSTDVEVEIHRLDDITRDQPPSSADFIKIDVEGYEYPVIQGAELFIKACKPVMVVEQKKGNSERYGFKTGAAIELLESWGAKVLWQMSGDFCLSW